MIDSPIITTGSGRSGSSMIAGVFNICGAFGGENDGSDRLYENKKIKNNILIPYLQSIGVDINGQYPLPSTHKLVIPTDLCESTINIIKSDGYKSGPWILKGSRFCITWPIWHYAFPNAKWIIVRRRTGDIISSCIKTDFMRAFKNKENLKAINVHTEAEGWKYMIHQYERCMFDMVNKGLNTQIMWTERLVWGDYQQLYNIIQWCGLTWKSEALQYIDPRLEKSRKKLNPSLNWR